MNELKPCPFCGGEAEFEIYEDDISLFNVVCKRCRAESAMFVEKEKATEAWNRRVKDERSDRKTGGD